VLDVEGGRGDAEKGVTFRPDFSAVAEARFQLVQTAARLGVVYSFKSRRGGCWPTYKRDPEGNIDRILAQILKDAPAVKQAEAT
jgi:hypothetical protein